MSIFYSDVLPKIEKWLLEELSGPEKESFSKKTKTLVELADKIATILEHLSGDEKIDRTFPFYPKKDELVFIRRVTQKAAERMGIASSEQLSDKALTEVILKKLEENSPFSESLPKGSTKPYSNYTGFVRAIFLFCYSKIPVILSASRSITSPLYSAP